MTLVACSMTWTTFPIIFLTTLALMRPEKHAVCTMNQIRKILRLRSSYLSIRGQTQWGIVGYRVYFPLSNQSVMEGNI